MGWLAADLENRVEAEEAAAVKEARVAAEAAAVAVVEEAKESGAEVAWAKVAAAAGSAMEAAGSAMEAAVGDSCRRRLRRLQVAKRGARRRISDELEPSRWLARTTGFGSLV